MHLLPVQHCTTSLRPAMAVTVPANVDVHSSDLRALVCGFSIYSSSEVSMHVLQDNLRRVSAEAVHSEAQNYFADEGQSAGTKIKPKKKNWFMQLFKNANSSKNRA